MKEIDDILMKSIGMNVQQLYSKYGHKKDWKDFLSDVYRIAGESDAILNIEGYKKAIGRYEIEVNSLNRIIFYIDDIEEDVSDYEFFITAEGKNVSGMLSRKKLIGGVYQFDMVCGKIHNSIHIKREDITIDKITQKIANFIYNHLIELPF